MAHSIEQIFKGGVVPGQGPVSETEIHNLILRNITIMEDGRESNIDALFNFDRPVQSAPYFDNIDLHDLAVWITEGHVIQVFLDRNSDSKPDFAGFLQSSVLHEDPDRGLIVDELVIYTVKGLGNRQLQHRRWHFSVVIADETRIEYLYNDNFEPYYNGVASVDSDDADANFLAYKIMGDGSTVSVDIVRENSLGQPVDPFLRIRTLGQNPVDVIKWSDVLAAEDKSVFESRIQADISAVIEPVLLIDTDQAPRIATLSAKNTYVDGQSIKTFSVFRTATDDRSFTEYVPGKGTSNLKYLDPMIQNGSALYDQDTGIVSVRNNKNLVYTYTGTNTLDFVVSPIDGMAANFAVKITSTAPTDGTVNVYKKENGIYIPLMPSVAGGTTVEAGKTYQLTCVGDCWTLAEFEEPSAGLKTKIGDKFYRVVKIGGLYWMAENLAYNATAETGDLDSASVWYDNDSSTYGDYGKLYCFTEAARAEILAAAPGWRFPTQAEMASLFTESVADLKAATGWTNAGTDGTGFSGVPGGKYFENAFSLYGTQGQWWCTPNNDALTAFNQCYLTDDSKGTAFVGAASYASVRLVKDV